MVSIFCVLVFSISFFFLMPFPFFCQLLLLVNYKLLIVSDLHAEGAGVAQAV
jgi:hypothetical protein